MGAGRQKTYNWTLLHATSSRQNEENFRTTRQEIASPMSLDVKSVAGLWARGREFAQRHRLQLILAEICIAQALSQDHLVERNSMLWAAS